MTESKHDATAGVTFQYYPDDSVDPGNSILIATVLFCVLLIAALPCMVCVGMRFRNHEDVESSEQDNASETINGGGAGGVSFVGAQLSSNRRISANRATKNGTMKRPRYRSDASNDKNVSNERVGDNYEDPSESSVDDDTDHSVKTGGASVASGFLNALLVTSPHGGGIKRRNQMHAAHREAQINLELDSDNSVMDNRSITNHSVLGRLSNDEVSIQDAVDAPTVGGKDLNDPMADQDSSSGLWNSTCGSWFRQLLLIADYDYETKRLVKLGGPFVMQAVLVGVMETTRVALIGKFIGTASLSAYVVVQLAVGTTDVFLLGMIDACTSLCSQAVGVGNKRLAGQYIQIATILFILCYIPIFFLWIFMIGPIFTWLGFDEKDDGLTREIGEQFTILFLFVSFIHGVNASSHALLDVIGKERYSTSFVSCEQVAATLATLVAALQPGASDLNLVGLLLIAVQASALIINSAVIAYHGWFDKFLDGLVGSFALRVRPICGKILCKHLCECLSVQL
jgi:hypothetical protein